MSEMEQYLTKTKTDQLEIVGVGVIFMAIGLGVALGLKRWFGWIFVVFGLLAVYAGLTSGSTDRAFLQQLEEEGIRSKAEADFASAVSVADDRARIGNEFIFRRKYPKLIRCRDVKEFHFIEDSPIDEPRIEGKVYLHMEDGSTEYLFEETENYQQDAELAAQLLQKRNPNIELFFPEDHGLLKSAAGLVKKLTHKDE